MHAPNLDLFPIDTYLQYIPLCTNISRTEQTNMLTIVFFFLYHFHTFLYTPSTLNPQPSTLVPSNFAININPKPQI